MSLRDLIWLRAARNLREKPQIELEKARFEFEAERVKRTSLLLSDLRSILFATLYFGDDKAASERAWYSLPSMSEYGIKNPNRAVGKSRGVREAEKKESQN